MTHRYYVRTDEGLELVTATEQVKFVPYPNGGYRMTWSDGSGFDVSDWVDADSDAQGFRDFLDRNLDR